MREFEIIEVFQGNLQREYNIKRSDVRSKNHRK